MFCDQIHDEWEYIPVETADEVMSCGNIVECNRLKNWNRWLKIRKQQYSHLGLMVCRSSTLMLMNESDKYRSRVECKWMVDLAQKLKINSHYTRDFPYSVSRDINNFIGIYIPDVICNEKGVSNFRNDIRNNFEMRASNVLLRNQLRTLKDLRPANSPGKLAIVGENINEKIRNSKLGYKGPIPTILVNSACNNKDDNNTLIAIRINDTIIKLLNNNSKSNLFELNTNSWPIYITRVNEDCWNDIIIENCGEISIQYKWEKYKHGTSKYNNTSNEQQIGYFYFDTRTSILGPGQIKRLPVLFRPKVIGPSKEMWLLQVNVLEKIDPISQIKIQFHGCSLPNDDVKKVVIELQKALFSEKVKNLCSKLTNKIVKNVFCDSLFVDRYYYNDDKMNYLYHAMQSKKSLSIDELLCQCMQLEESFRENYLDLISRTAVTLLKKEVVPNHDKMTNRELNAHKTVLVAMDCIDLLLSTYEPDYDEACQKINSYLMNPNLQNTTNSSGSAVMSEIIERINANNATIREEWLDLMKPMVHKRLEWVVDIISDYDFRLPECKHNKNQKK